MVVVMIAVASLILARIASSSLRLASTSVSEERDVRNRWAATSLRRYSLNSASTLLSSSVAAQQDDAGSPAIYWRYVRLAGQRWRVIVSDESAKLNLIRYTLDQGESSASDVMKKIITGQNGVQPSASLGRAARHQAVRWDPWFDLSRGEYPRSPRTIASATQRITLWGDGKVNLLSSEDATIDQLWRSHFGQNAPAELHTVRRQPLPPDLRQMTGLLGLRETQADFVQNWFTTKSTCRSAWVFCESDRRVGASFFVEWGNANGAAEHRVYEY